MYKSCSKCGGIHPINTRCKAGAIANYNKYKSEESKLRSSTKWTNKAIEIKERSQYLCSVCKDEGIYTYDNLEVHHITKVKDDHSLLLEDSNLICLCREHHRLADEGKIKSEYLRQLAMTRDGQPGNTPL